MTETLVCPGCDGKYKRIGVHWSKACGFPEIAGEVEQVFIGLLMGDAWVNEPYGSNKHAVLEVASINERFLAHLHERLSPFTTEPRFYRSGEEVAKLAKDAGQNADAEKTNDQYHLRSRAHPFFDELRGWYGKEGKRFPEELTLTSTIAKYWFACDGLVGWSSGQWADEEYGHISFAASNEIDRSEYLFDLFEGLDVTPVVDSHKVRFNCEDSQKLIDWMGEPIPDFDYKWEINDINEHQKLKP